MAPAVADASWEGLDDAGGRIKAIAALGLIARVLRGFDTTTRATKGRSIAVRCRLQRHLVIGLKRPARARRSSGLTPIRPSSRHTPPSTTAICAKERCTSIRAPSPTGVDEVLAVFPEVLGDGQLLSELVEGWESIGDL